MGFMFRVRLSSFFAGAATASVLGSYLLYKDYKLAHQAISQQVQNIYVSLDERFETLNGRIKALETLREAEPATQVESSE